MRNQNQNTNKAKKSLGIGGILTIILVIGKLIGISSLPWWITFAPLLISPIGGILILTAICLIGDAFQTVKEKALHKSKKSDSSEIDV